MCLAPCSLRHRPTCCSPPSVHVPYLPCLPPADDSTGGMPDLLLWHAGQRAAKLSEVKGPRDRLSDQQRAWMAALAGGPRSHAVRFGLAEACRLLLSAARHPMRPGPPALLDYGCVRRHFLCCPAVVATSLQKRACKRRC